MSNDNSKPSPCGSISIGDHTDYVRIQGSTVFMRQPELLLGGLGMGDNQLTYIDALTLDQAGHLYVVVAGFEGEKLRCRNGVDSRGTLIKVWSLDTMDGRILEEIASGQLEAAGLAPFGRIRAVSAGCPNDPLQQSTLYVLDSSEERDPVHRILIRPHLHSRQWSQLAYAGFKEEPLALTVDGEGRIVLVEKKGWIEVLKVDGRGRDRDFGNKGRLRLKDIQGKDAKDLVSVTTDEDSNIYVSDSSRGRIIKVAKNGTKVRRIYGRKDFKDEVKGIAVGRNGILYGRDEAAGRYLAFDPDGDRIAAFGDTGSTPDRQMHADAFCIDPQRGKMVIADRGNYRIAVHSLRKRRFLARDFIRRDAVVIQPAWIAGGKKGDDPGDRFRAPNELGFDADGNLWCGDVKELHIQIYDRKGRFVGIVGGEGEEPGQFKLVDKTLGKCGAEAIRRDSQGRMYAVDRGGKRINVYDGRTREPLHSISDARINDPTGLVIDASDNLYLGDQGTGKIHQFQNDGTFVRTFQDKVGEEPILVKTETLAVDDSRDRLFASSEKESRIEVFRLSTGEYLRQHVGEKQSANLREPGRYICDVEGLATDTANDWIISSDEDNGRILISHLGSDQLLDPEADFAFLGAFGWLGNLPGEFYSADGVTIDPKVGLLAVADQANLRIQAFRITDIKAAFGLV